MKKRPPFIPKEHSAAYDFLIYFENVLVAILHYADSEKLSNVKINFKNEADFHAFQAIADAREKEELTEWLLDSDYREELLEYHKKHLFFSLLRDFYNYYSASLENIVKPNVSVAWALLRRPLQETLAYIEWLAVDANELLMLMLKSENAEEYEITGQRKSTTVKNNVATLLGQQTILPNEMNVYEFRYSRKYQYSLNGILNGANHLVANRSKSFQTSPSGLNFVFLDGNEFDRGLGLYYASLPYLLFYSGNIIMDLFADIAEMNDYTKIINKYNLMLKSFKATRSLTLKDALNLIGIDVPIICTKCGKRMEKEKYIQQFAYSGVRCPRCFHSIKTYSYIFEFEKIELDDVSYESNEQSPRNE